MTDENIEFIRNIIIDVRSKLSQKYDIAWDFKDFSGLCDIACEMVIKQINQSLKYGSVINAKRVHGEQKHSPSTEVKNWCIQHTWLEINIDGRTIYADPTSQQFQFINKDIPDYYISYRKPKWYYPDRENPVWNGITSKINKHIKVKHTCLGADNKPRVVREGIVEFCQYKIWGSICSIIKKYLMKK